MPIILARFYQKFRSQLSQLNDARMGVLLIPLIILVVIGTIVYSLLEGWSILDALYATVITMTTVGYGDLSPQTSGGRLFAVFFTLAAIGLAGYSFSEVAAYVIDQQVEKRERQRRERRMNKVQALNNHIIICGGSVIGHRTANEFRKRDTPFILIESDEEALRWALLWLHPEYVNKRVAIWQERADVEVAADEAKSVDELANEVGILYLKEDPTQETTLRHAGLERAAGIITVMNDDRDNMAIILSARDMANRLDNPQLRIISRVVDEWNMHRLNLAGADKVIAPNMRGAHILAAEMLDPIMTEFWDKMMFNSEEVIRFTDMHIADRPEFAGKTIAQLREESGQMALAIKRKSEFIYAPELSMVLEPDDSVIVLGQAV